MAPETFHISHCNYESCRVVIVFFESGRVDELVVE